MPVVHVLKQGNLANQMIQYMVACRIASSVPGCRISNVDLTPWGIAHPTIPSDGGPERLVEGQRVDADELATDLNNGSATRVNLLAYGQWLSDFPSRADCISMFPPDPQFQGYGQHELVCNIRGGEVLDGRHPDYTLLPIKFYAELAERTGLQLVFMGQIEHNKYCLDLRSAFPDAKFHESRGAMEDFQTFRNSVNLVPAISTFSWLSAWLSNADRIYQPLSGLFHPVQCPDVDLLPIGDNRYCFFLFPVYYSVPVDCYRESHAALSGLWRRVRPSTIDDLRGPPRWVAGFDDFLAAFDEKHYLETYSDVAGPVHDGHIKSGKSHFRTNGYREQRQAFPMDRQWYSMTYPIAAVEVGQNDYATLEQHYAHIGWARGYRSHRTSLTTDSLAVRAFNEDR